jgi:hypothetical protein
LDCEAAVQVAGSEELMEVGERLLGDPEWRRSLGERAGAALEAHQGATLRTAAHLVQNVQNVQEREGVVV